jgi:hypothetical protein
MPSYGQSTSAPRGRARRACNGQLLHEQRLQIQVLAVLLGEEEVARAAFEDDAGLGHRELLDPGSFLLRFVQQPDADIPCNAGDVGLIDRILGAGLNREADGDDTVGVADEDEDLVLEVAQGLSEVAPLDEVAAGFVGGLVALPVDGVDAASNSLTGCVGRQGDSFRT